MIYNLRPCYVYTAVYGVILSISCTYAASFHRYYHFFILSIAPQAAVPDLSALAGSFGQAQNKNHYGDRNGFWKVCRILLWQGFTLYFLYRFDIA
jgi:hypothetical protein